MKKLLLLSAIALIGCEKEEECICEVAIVHPDGHYQKTILETDCNGNPKVDITLPDGYHLEGLDCNNKK